MSLYCGTEKNQFQNDEPCKLGQSIKVDMMDYAEQKVVRQEGLVQSLPGSISVTDLTNDQQ